MNFDRKINLALIKSIRVSKGITQKEIAESLGISKGQYSRREAGIYKFKVNDLPIIARRLGITLEKIFDN